MVCGVTTNNTNVTFVGGCPAMQPSLNGQIFYSSGLATSYQIGTTATLYCNPGYNPIGSTSATCTQSGWSSFALGTCMQNGIGIG